MRASRLLLLAAVLAVALAATLAASASQMSYIFKRGDRSYIVTGNMDLHEIGRLSKRWAGDYLWVRKGRREYLIRDDATMSEARKALAQLEVNQDQYHALMKQMSPIQKRHEALEEQVDAISDRFDDDEDDLTLSEQRELEGKLHDLQRRLKVVEKELRAYEVREEDLDQKQEKLEAVADKKLEEIIDLAIAAGVAERVR